MSANTPTSFRLPFETELAGQPEGVRNAHRYTFSAILDLNNAIQGLSAKMGKGTAASSVPTVAETFLSAVSAVSTFNGGSGGVSFFPNLGTVNKQIGATAYAVQDSDNGAKIVLGASGGVALNLNFAVAAPWFAVVDNDGTGVVTLTPSSGTLNGGATIPTGGFGIVFFDGANWWSGVSSPPTTGGVTQIVAGTNVTISPAGGTGVVVVNSTTTAASGVTQIIAGANVTVSPSGGTGAVTVSATTGGGGGGSYSLGGTLSTSNVTLGAGAGSGASVGLVQGVDGNHRIAITTGTGTLSGNVYTLTFTTPRSQITYPVIQCPLSLIGHLHVDLASDGGSASNYVAHTRDTALDANTTYYWNVICP